MNDPDVAAFTPRTMSHRDMVRAWRARLAVTVSARVVDYARFDEVWWQRGGGAWESLPDGPFALSLAAGRTRLAALEPGDEHAVIRDPWSVARERLRMGGACPAERWHL